MFDPEKSGGGGVGSGPRKVDKANANRLPLIPTLDLSREEKLSGVYLIPPAVQSAPTSSFPSDERDVAVCQSLRRPQK